MTAIVVTVGIIVLVNMIISARALLYAASGQYQIDQRIEAATK